MLKIQYCSDLHLEFPENAELLKMEPILPVGDILVLAGDIVPFAVMDKYDWFFEEVSKNFNQVYWIPGNHEYYYSDILKRTGVFSEEIQKNVHLLNNTEIVYEGVHLMFTTLWTHIPPKRQWLIANRLADFQVIKIGAEKFAPEDYNALFAENFKFLENTLSDFPENEKVVVITHHVPTHYNYPARYKGDELNSGFAVELFEFIEKHRPDYWIFGHHHSNEPLFEIGNTKLVTNQLGYVRFREIENYSASAVIEV